MLMPLGPALEKQWLLPNSIESQAPHVEVALPVVASEHLHPHAGGGNALEKKLLVLKGDESSAARYSKKGQRKVGAQALQSRIQAYEKWTALPLIRQSPTTIEIPPLTLRARHESASESTVTPSVLVDVNVSVMSVQGSEGDGFRRGVGEGEGVWHVISASDDRLGWSELFWEWSFVASLVEIT
jgi:hypothetical protein